MVGGGGGGRAGRAPRAAALAERSLLCPPQQQQQQPRRPASPEELSSSKEEKDAELDRRIAALRRKNQALIQRYQEIEEDRRRAEQEGVAVTGARRPRTAEPPAQPPERRRGGPEVGGSGGSSSRLGGQQQQERRGVGGERRPARVPARAPRSIPRGAATGSRSRPAEGPPSWPRSRAESSGAGKGGGGGRGRRVRGRGGPAEDAAGPDRRSQEWEERRLQNIEQMKEEMERIAEYERGQRDGFHEKNPVRNFLDDPRRSGPFTESNRREGSRRHIRNWGGADFDKVRTDLEQGKEWSSQGWSGGRHRGALALDMTLSMTGRERAEYARWKQERDRIDQERLARHRQPTGEWRREWDAEKMDPTLKERDALGDSSGGWQDESKRAPKQPTFGEFLLGQHPDQRQKIKGREHRPGSPSKLGWAQRSDREKEELDQGSPAEASGASVPQAESQIVEEEEEDQWEDVSEDEEAEGSSRKDSSSEEEKEGTPPPFLPSLPPWQQPAVLAPPKEASPREGAPPIPFGPAEGYQPVSDWGEEMELSSPRADSRRSPTAVLVGGSSAGAAEGDPALLLAKQGSLPVARSAGSSAAPTPSGPEMAERKGPAHEQVDVRELSKPGGNGGQLAM